MKAGLAWRPLFYGLPAFAATALVAALWLLWPSMPLTESSPYAAPRWLPGGHLQTIYAAKLMPRPVVIYRRERWDTPDGDFIDLDWADAPSAVSDQRSAGSAPLVVLFHGLEGSSRSHYALALMAALRGLKIDQHVMIGGPIQFDAKGQNVNIAASAIQNLKRKPTVVMPKASMLTF